MDDRYTEEIVPGEDQDEEEMFDKEVHEDDDMFLMHHLLTEVFRD